jgi:nucleotide-binding universal stress UspA family protein
MFQRILVPIDVSDPDVAAKAVEDATTLAKSYGSQLRLIAVVNPMVAVSPMEYIPQVTFDALGEFERTEIAKIAATIDLPKNRISSEVRDGGTYAEVLAAAEDWKADLIVIGAHKRSMATYLLGSTAAAIVRHAKCAVLVLRGDKAAHVF